MGPPIAGYTTVWADRINAADPLPENGSSAQSYPAFITAEQTRLNVVYVGSDDGLVHGFESGSFDVNGNFVSTGNDGKEVLAYMPAAVVNTIHSSTSTLDFSNSQYGHNFFVDATPATGDVFYGNQWHTLLVGGLGPGGAALYALDVTNPRHDELRGRQRREPGDRRMDARDHQLPQQHPGELRQQSG